MPNLADDWPFEDPPNVAVVTTREVTEDKVPILFVSHDKEDGAWQFLTGGPAREDDARVVALRRIWLLDLSIRPVGGPADGLAGFPYVAARSVAEDSTRA